MPYLEKTQRRILNFTKYYDLETSFIPETATIFANYGYNFTLNITNTGNAKTNFTLVSDGWDQYLNFPSKILNVRPQESREIQIELNIPDPENVLARDYTFRIHAIADGSENTVISTEIATITMLDPDYTPPSVTYISNYGTPAGLIFPQSSWIQLHFQKLSPVLRCEPEGH